MQDGDALNQIINNSRIGGLAFILEHHVAFTLLVGGILISAIGMLTRLAIVFQFPVFIGAIINFNVDYGLYCVIRELTFSIFITLILIVFFYRSRPVFSRSLYL